MKKLVTLFLVVVCVLGQSEVSWAAPMGTAFIYQGRLSVSGKPADGKPYDFEFKLFDDPSAGSQKGSTVPKNDVVPKAGVFSVTLDFGSDVFNGDARWLQISVRPGASTGTYTKLSPRQKVTPTPYALHTRGIFVDSTGNVGIGKFVPDEELDVDGHINSSETYKLSGNTVLSNPGTNNIFIGDGAGEDNSAGTHNTYVGKSAGNKSTAGTHNVAVGCYAGAEDKIGSRNTFIGCFAAPNPMVGINQSGNVFIGYQAGTHEGGNNKLYIENSNSSSPLIYGEFDNDLLKINGTLEVDAVSGGSITGERSVPTSGDYIKGVLGYKDSSTNVGVYGRNYYEYYGTLGGWDDNVGHCGVFGHAGYGKNIFGALGTTSYAGLFQGKVCIKNTNGATVIELGEGLDYAEGFDVSETDEVAPGTVLVIDSRNSGQLTCSTQAYDRKVAGIVAGANGLSSAVRLGVGQFDCDVALAGRVYCNVDATKTAIEPGDLLTTSAIPGYAMKPVDYTRAQGAILGKAMEKLEKGKKAQILVLVTLQ